MGHSIIFGLFKQTLQFIQYYNEMNVIPVSGVGIRTCDVQNVSLLHWPLDQGSDLNEYLLSPR